MKKTLVSAVLALALVVAGVAPAAHATGSNAGAVIPNYFSQSGTLQAPSLIVGSDVTYGSISVRLVPSASAWAALQNTTAVFTPGGNATLDGAALTGARFYSSVINSSGNPVNFTASTSTTQTYSIPASASVSSAAFYIYYNFGTGMNNSLVTAGTYAFTPSLLINGSAINFSDYTVTYSYSLNHPGSFTANPAATYVSKSSNTCVNTTGYSAGDVLTITQYNNGVAGYTNSGQISSYMYGSLDRAAPAGSTPSGSSLASLSSNTGVYTYSLTSSDLNTLLLVNGSYNGSTSNGAETFDISVTRNGTEVTASCFAGALSAPTVNNTGANVTLSISSPAIAGFESLYTLRCYGSPVTPGPGPAPVTATNGSCTMGTTSASTNYNFYYQASLMSSNSGIYLRSPNAASLGAQGGSVQQVAPQAPAIVFNQPKFEIPAKIAISASGKVSLSGKDMGVTSVVVGGKDQKVDVNSDTKLEFDTTGLAKGVHDLVMKGAFGTYTIQKAIQVGEAVVTKVAAVSARQVGMAGGELSISGQGLEGTTQITMNGQVLEIVSKTDSKVTFKVPASTVASVNSLKIEGAFVPVIFKNAFSYTK
jgi:hypothetical protein